VIDAEGDAKARPEVRPRPKRNWGVIASLIETAKHNDVDPQAYLASTRTVLVNGHLAKRIDDLMPSAASKSIPISRVT
jgi:transposase IS66-like protein